jgi:hypothetical protein
MGILEDVLMFEKSLKELVIKYNLYSNGREKLEPLKMLGAVDGMAKKRSCVEIPNTALRYKYNSLVDKFTTLKTSWSRASRLSEERKYAE